jgi:hypothetical protein
MPTSTAAPLTPTREATSGQVEEETAGRLISPLVDAPPVIDGQLEEAWAAAVPLEMPLTWGLDGSEYALDLTIRTVHTKERLYFFAQWPGVPLAAGDKNTLYNKITVHWRIPDQAAQHMDCSVVCHTAFADGSGRFAYANAETIPQGGSGALEAAGDWDAGTWTLEWSRPLVNANPFDLQFDDRDRAYPFLVKVFERIEGRPDPVSNRHLLILQE